MMLSALLQDLRYAVRTFMKAPGFTAAVVVTLVLGIAANTAMFSLLNAVVLRTLPVPDPQHLWLLYQESPPAVGDVIGGLERSDIFAHSALRRMEAAVPRAASVAGMSSIAGVSVRIERATEGAPASLQLVSGSFFTTVGITAEAGRVLAPDDNRMIDSHPIAVLRYGFAQQHFGDAQSAIGRTIAINGVSLTVIGVAQRGFQGVSIGNAVDVWLPTTMQHAVASRTNGTTHNAKVMEPWVPQSGVEWLNLVVRAPRETLEAVQNAVAGAFREEIAVEGARRGESPETDRLLRSELRRESFAGGFYAVRTQYSAALLFLAGMVTLLLLMVCVNIANLLLARGAARRREIAVRMSVGASRGRLVRQLLVESAALALLGTLVALPGAQWVSAALAELAAVRNTLPQGFALDGRVLVFTVAASAVCTLFFGLFPALRATAFQVADSVRSGGAVSDASGTRTMRPLVVGQVALSVLLVTAAVLFGRSLLSLWRLDPGFDRERIVSVRLTTSDEAAFTPEQVRLLRARVLERVQTISGVLAADLSYTGIVSGAESISGNNNIEGYQPAPGEAVRLQENRVGPGYFAATGMTLREGRLLTERDTDGSTPVVVVNEAMVRRYFGGQSPIGKRLGYGTLDTQIVGVVADARLNGLRREPVPMAFYPLDQRPRFPRYLDARAIGDPAAVGGSVSRLLADLDPRVRVDSVRSVSDALNRGIRRDRALAYVASAFGIVALLLACIGVYGVLSYAVARRIRELGLRAALGAEAADLRRLVVSDGMRIVLSGIVTGVAATLVATRLIQSLLFGVAASDPMTHAAVAAGLAAAGFCACALPAWRASRVDPASALRTE
jgi:predicted permease